jgi:hypothetical protein
MELSDGEGNMERLKKPSSQSLLTYAKLPLQNPRRFGTHTQLPSTKAYRRNTCFAVISKPR